MYNIGLKVADDSTLYGCCVLVEELVQKPSGLLSMIAEKHPSRPSLSRHILTTKRCYCILSRVPSFELHFGVLNRCVYVILNAYKKHIYLSDLRFSF